MKTNDNGQGVINGVQTDNDKRIEMFQKEETRLNTLFVSYHQILTKNISKLSEQESFANLNKLVAINGFISALNELGDENNNIGGVSYSLNQKREIKIKYNFNVPVYDDEESETPMVVGVDTKKRKVIVDYIRSNLLGYDGYLKDVEFLNQVHSSR